MPSAEAALQVLRTFGGLFRSHPGGHPAGLAGAWFGSSYLGLLKPLRRPGLAQGLHLGLNPACPPPGRRPVNSWESTKPLWVAPPGRLGTRLSPLHGAEHPAGAPGAHAPEAGAETAVGEEPPRQGVGSGRGALAHPPQAPAERAFAPSENLTNPSPRPGQRHCQRTDQPGRPGGP